MRRCVIIGGAGIGDYGRVRSYLREDDFFIFCDSGLRHREALGAEPDLIIGDFDSHPRPETETETIVLPCVKDDTDTVFAVREALRRGFEEFLFIGAVGQRLDHSLANVSLLLRLDTLEKKALLVDDYSEMEIVSRQSAGINCRFPFFSLLSVDGPAEGICVEEAKYPLRDAALDCEYPYGVSNEPLPGKTARVTVARGRLLLIRVF